MDAIKKDFLDLNDDDKFFLGTYEQQTNASKGGRFSQIKLHNDDYDEEKEGRANKSIKWTRSKKVF